MTQKEQAPTSRSRPPSIQGKLVLLLCILLIPTLLIQAYVYIDRVQTRGAEELQNNLDLARSVAKTFDAFLQDILSDELVLGLTFTMSPSHSSEEQNSFLTEARKIHPAVWHLSWVSPAGIVLASSAPEFIGRDLGNRPYFREIAAGQEWVVSKLMKTREIEKAHFEICWGRIDNEGKLLGVIVATILSENLDRILSLERHSGGGISLIDSEGMLVFRQRGSNYAWEDRYLLQRYPIISEALKGHEIKTTMLLRGESSNRLVAFAPTSLTGWVVAVGQSEEHLVSSIRASLLPQSILFLIITISAFCITLVSSRKIANAIEKIRAHAVATGKGEVPDPLDSFDFTELDDLANAFNQMAEAIRNRETERRRAEEKLQQSEQELAIELAAAKHLQQVSIQLIQAEDIDALIEQILDTIMAVLNADFACIQMFYPEQHGHQGELRLLGHRGFNPQAAKFWEWVSPASRSTSGAVLTSGQRFAVSDIEKSEFMAGGDDQAICIQAGIRAAQSTPLISRSGTLLGVFSTHWREIHELTPSEMRTLDVLARQVADLIENKRAEEELRLSHDELELKVQERTAALERANKELRQIPSMLITAQEEERKRLAAELHDSIGQTLAALKFRLEHMAEILRNGKAKEALGLAESFVSTLQRSINETRAIYMGLRPKVLEDFGVVAALRWYREELLRLYPERHIEIDTVEESEVPIELHVPIFRIAQEALNNVEKHSKGEWVDVILSKNGSELELVISDDGVGMDVNQILQSSMARSLGLTSMRERAEITGGSFSIESGPGKGTKVRVCWPVEEDKSNLQT